MIGALEEVCTLGDHRSGSGGSGGCSWEASGGRGGSKIGSGGGGGVVVGVPTLGGGCRGVGVGSVAG